MSEKRFSETERNFYYTSLVIDKKTQEELGTNKAVKLLNALHEENEQLKHQIEIEKKWQLEKDRYYVKIKEENDQLRRLFEEMKQPITINLTEEDEKELRKLLGLIDDE